MDYVIQKTQQISVTADSPDEAITKALNGEGTPISVNYGATPRPQQPQAINPTLVAAMSRAQHSAQK